MAIIKCPECGHQVSDKAPTCPSCGVEIAGNIVRCHQCGAIYLKDLDACPICNHPNVAPRKIQQPVQTVVPPQQPKEKPAPEKPQQPVKKKKHWGALLFSFLLALVVCGVCFYFYHSAKDNKENEAYTYAMTSSDPLVLQSFLDTYRDATASRRDSIQTRLTAIQQAARDWADACMSRSKIQLQQFIDRYPESPHKGDALNKIDSIDWAFAKNQNTIDAFSNYQKEHPNGAHVEEADELIHNLNATTLRPEEAEMIRTTFRRFFQSINSRNDEGIAQTVAEALLQFQGRPDATRRDVIAFMHKLWPDNVVNQNWHIMGDYQIEKKDVGSDQFEYAVQFTTVQNVDYAPNGQSPTPTGQSKYRVTSRLTNDGQIYEFNMTKIVP